MFWALRKKGVQERMIKIVESMYDGAKTCVRTGEGYSSYFEVKVGLHQGSALSPFLFITVVDAITEEIHGEGFWELLFADDLVVTARSEDELQNRIIRWQEKLESQGLRVNARKTEVMACCKEGGQQVVIRDARENTLQQVQSFKYLGSTLTETGGCEKEVKERIKSGWSKWKEVKGVVCDRRMPRSVKSKVYKTMVRPVLLYGAETWALRRKEEKLLERTEMRMLRWMLGVSLLDRCTNEEIRSCLKVTVISEKLREARLRWFGHVVRRDETSLVRSAWDESVTGRRSRGRQKLRWSDVLKKDMEMKGVREQDAKDRVMFSVKSFVKLLV